MKGYIEMKKIEKLTPKIVCGGEDHYEKQVAIFIMENRGKINDLVDVVNAIPASKIENEEIVILQANIENISATIHNQNKRLLKLEKNETKTEEIKPCAFCGSKAYAKRTFYAWVVECLNEDCIASDISSKYVSRDSAIKSWNKRAWNTRKGEE